MNELDLISEALMSVRFSAATNEKARLVQEKSLRDEIADQIAALDTGPFDCCGCSSYDQIRDACAQIARGER